MAIGPMAQQPATIAINDCYLVGFAEVARAHLVTSDKGLAKTAEYRDVPVTLIR